MFYFFVCYMDFYYRLYAYDNFINMALDYAVLILRKI
ncbi:hypothetical protein Metal_1285 [Methylomicrobium album BG8]|uniref:Uncharacterized protein n=1 Tax=Methylomicrobium album BG8 TaxID=686340 RepID=H8GJ95_METAL|nr:hypothetical protein Metal_1285 [Methylomicrobium album BG8]